LDRFLELASAHVLRRLIKALVSRRPDPFAPWQGRVSRRQIRRECLEVLTAQVSADAAAKDAAEAAALWALWEDLEPDLRELDTYGGGPEETETRVADLLYELAKKLKTGTIPQPARRELLERVLAYRKRANAGMDDFLSGVADATCYTLDDHRDLAQRLEGMGKESTIEDAIDIYRRLGDRDRYLALRSARLRDTSDYHELSTFYWQTGQRDKALQVARDGLKKKVEGRKDELRAFLAKHAKGTRVARSKRVSHGVR
jgi:hypothetical protein